MPYSRIKNYTIFYNNSEEYHLLKREIFASDLYYFETKNLQPLIIDAGAHIGMSTLYFKQLYPGSQIIAIEPNPNSFTLLEKNSFENQLDDVTTLQVALSDHVGKEQFHYDNSDQVWYSTASFHKGSWAGTQKSDSRTVQTQLLSTYVTQPVDFLKMDIEGAEQKVLYASRSILPMIQEIHIEFHTHPSQSLSKLVELLEKTHTVELFKGTQTIPIKKASGLVQIRAVKK